MNWKDPVDVIIIFMCTLIVIYGIACGVVSFKRAGTWVDYPDYKAASVCDYEVAFIYRATYETDEDFYRNVTAQIEWLRKREFEVIKLEYVYGNDVTQSLILRFAVIKYKEKKNDN